MARAQATGIVLSKSQSGEADFICRIFTKEKGRESFIFRGLRKSSKRPLTASEPGTILRLIYYTAENRSLSTVSEIDIISSHPGIREESGRIFAQYFAVELIDRTTGQGMPDEKMFTLLSAGLDALETTSDIAAFAVFFTLRFLMIQGLMAPLAECSSCGEKFPEQFSLNSSMQMLCPDCSGSDEIMMGPDCLMFARKCMEMKFSVLTQQSYRREDFPVLLSKLISYTEQYFSVNLKSKSALLSCLKSNE